MDMDFATVKAISATIGLVIFMGVFVVAVAITLRPGAKKYYQDQAKKILKDNPDA